MSEMISKYLIPEFVPGVSTNLDSNLGRNLQISRNTKKLVKVCLHCSKAVQMSLQFDEVFDQKLKIVISRIFDIFMIFTRNLT